MSSIKTGRTTARTPKSAATAAAVTAEAVTIIKAADHEAEAEAVAEVKALAENPTRESVDAMFTIIGAADDRLRLLGFRGRVAVSVMVGYALKAEVTVRLGTAPDGFTAAADEVKVYAKGGAEWLGRRYSTLEQCWRIATHHTVERLERFVESWREVHGVNPEAVAAYAAWVNADAKGGKTASKASVKTLAERKTASAKAKAKAEAVAVERRTQRAELHKTVKAAKPSDRPVAGCPMTAAEWSSMTAETLLAVSLLADAMRVALNKAASTADEAEAVNTAEAETGPRPTRAARVKVKS